MEQESGNPSRRWYESLQQVFTPQEAEQACLILLRLLGKEPPKQKALLDHTDLAALVVLVEAGGFRELPSQVAPGEEVVVAKLMALLLLYRSALEQGIAAKLLAASATLNVYGQGKEVLEDLLVQGASFGGKRG